MALKVLSCAPWFELEGTPKELSKHPHEIPDWFLVTNVQFAINYEPGKMLLAVDMPCPE